MAINLQRLILSLIITCSLFTSTFLGQVNTLKLNYRTSIDGLSSDWVNSITEDNQGFLWIGSRHGLNIYDGKEFNSLFHRDNDSTTISADDISFITTAKSGQIIAGSWGAGINFIDPLTKSVTKPKKDGISETLRIKSIVEQPDSSLWIGTYKQGIYKYDRLNNTLNKIAEEPSNSLIFDNCESLCSHHDTLWIASFDNGIGFVDPITNTIKKYKHPQFNDLLFTETCTLNSNGDKLLIGTRSSMYHELVTEKGLVTLTKNISHNGALDLRVSSILIDNKGATWITSSNGIQKKSPKSDDFIFYAESKNHDNIFCSIQDSRGMIWFGNWGTGLSKYIEKPNTFLETDPGGFNKWYVHSICSFDKEKSLIASSFGTFFFHKNKDTVYTPNFTGNKKDIQAVTHKNNLHIINYKENGYLCLIDQLGFYHIDQQLHVSKHKLSHNAIKKDTLFSFIKEFPDGKIWVGTSTNGLHLHDSKTGVNKHFSTTENNENYINSDNVHDIFLDKSNQTWICTEDGVMKFDNSSNKFIPHFITLNHSDSATSDISDVKCMIQDENSNYWLSCSYGLVNYNLTTKSSILYEFGKETERKAIYNLTKRNNFIWGTVLGEIYSFNLTTKTASLYPSSDGIKLQPYKPSLIIDQDIIYIGYENGIESIKPDELVKDKEPLKIYFEKFIINDEEKNTPTINESILKKEQIILNHNENNITLLLSVIDFRKSKHDAFTHQLIGFDEKPRIHDSQQKRIKYTNLDPGEYEFVIASIVDKSGKGNFQKSILIKIERPIWEKWWFILLLFVFLSVLVYSAIKYRVYTIQRKNIELTRYANAKNIEIIKTYEELAIKDEHLNSNLNYASFIQNTLQPNKHEISSVFPKHFVLYQPRDVVSGDFYWSTKLGTKRIFVVADCTGHGVSGAFISVIGITYIRSIINVMRLTRPDKILNQLHDDVSNSLRQETSNIKDGMDISLICYDESTKELQIASAQGLAIVAADNKDIIKVNSNKFPVGGSSSHYSNRKGFELSTYKVTERTMVYLFTDGYQDQFGGDHNKKFMKKRFRELITSNNTKDVTTQKQLLENELTAWKQDTEQTDDILVVGIELE